MIRLVRPEPAPASLSSAAAVAEMAAAEAYYAGWNAGDSAFTTFTAYDGYDVINALRAMCHSKCAYCERTIEKGTREVEHYRPKGGVGDLNHPGYWWLAFTWTNLLPTCGPCNKGLKQHLVTVDMTVDDVEKLQAKPPAQLMGKANNFPVGAARLTAKVDDHVVEQPHLIDPTRSDPADYLRWSHASDFSVVVPKIVAGQNSIEGEETIRCLALNRSGLVEARTKSLNILRAQRVRIMDGLEKSRFMPDEVQQIYLEAILESVKDMQQHCGPKTEFAAMASAFVEAFRQELKAWLAVHAPALVLENA